MYAMFLDIFSEGNERKEQRIDSTNWVSTEQGKVYVYAHIIHVNATIDATCINTD